MFSIKNLLWLVLIMHINAVFSEVRPDLIQLSSIDNTIIQNPRYFGKENFLNRKVPGYNQPELLCTRKAALALKQVNMDMKEKGFLLVVYDAYRPQKAVDAFVAWRDEKENLAAKVKYYPNLTKKEIFKQGYILEKSDHCKGTTFDLTIIPVDQRIKPITRSTKQLANKEIIPFLDDNTVDMGSSFDLFHPVSHHGTNLITPVQTRNRTLLREVMRAHGFKEIQEEWWHYSFFEDPNA